MISSKSNGKESTPQAWRTYMHEAANADLVKEVQELRRAFARAQTELVRLRADEQQARHLALHDPLTMLPNRRYFHQRLQELLSRETFADAAPAPALLYLDVDGFKDLNDAHGHQTGDELLRVFASRLVRAVRAEDMVARLGGDEFACLIVGTTDRDDLERRVRRIEAAVCGRVRAGRQELTVRSSIGVATYPADGRTAGALLESADAAMYRAKRAQSGPRYFDAPELVA